MSENRYGEKSEESETGMKLQNCETQWEEMWRQGLPLQR